MPTSISPYIRLKSVNSKKITPLSLDNNLIKNSDYSFHIFLSKKGPLFCNELFCKEIIKCNYKAVKITFLNKELIEYFFGCGLNHEER